MVEALMVAAFLGFLGSLILGLISVVSPQKVPWIQSRKHGATLFFLRVAPICFVAVVVLAMFLPRPDRKPDVVPSTVVEAPTKPVSESEPEPTNKVEPILESDEEKLRRAIGKSIKVTGIEVQPNGGKPKIVVRHRFDVLWSETEAVKRNAWAMETVAKAAANLFPELSDVTVEAETTMIDRHGRESGATALWFTLRGADLKQIQWQNMHLAMLLDLVEARSSPAGKRAIRKYCEDIKVGDSGARFCLSALTSSPN